MNIIYRAFDGKEFEEKDDCINYEEKIIAEKYKNDIIGLSEEFEQISLFDGVENFFQESYFVLVKTDEAVNFIEENSYNWNVYTPPLKKGTFYFNEMNNEWQDIDEKINEFYQEIEEMTGIKNKLYRLSQDDN